MFIIDLCGQRPQSAILFEKSISFNLLTNLFKNLALRWICALLGEGVVFVSLQYVSQMLVVSRFLELSLLVGSLLALWNGLLKTMILHRTNACIE